MLRNCPSTLGSQAFFLTITKTYFVRTLLHNTNSSETLQFHVYMQIFMFQIYIPILPIVGSCCLTIFTLKRSENSHINAANRAVSVTIVLFTLIYTVLNLPFVAMYCVMLLKNNLGLDIDFSWDNNYFYKFFTLFNISLNAAFNPLLYFTRMRQMRESTWVTVQHFFSIITFNTYSPIFKEDKTDQVKTITCHV